MVRIKYVFNSKKDVVFSVCVSVEISKESDH